MIIQQSSHSYPNIDESHASQTFIRNHTLPNWDTWHQQFGHIGYTGLQRLLDKKLVEGFNVDLQSPKPDCIACTEAKQHVERLPKTSQRNTEPGQLMHIDLWGKYAIKSINGNQYYLLFMDNTKWYTTIQCLKWKSDSTQGVTGCEKG